MATYRTTRAQQQAAGFSTPQAYSAALTKAENSGKSTSQAYRSVHSSSGGGGYSVNDRQVKATDIGEDSVAVPQAPRPSAFPDVGATNAGLANPLFGLTTDANGTLLSAPQQGAERGGEQQSMQDYVSSLYDDVKPPNAERLYDRSPEKRALDRAQQDVNNYASQINTITAQAQAQQLALEGQGRGQTSSFIGGEQARINREAAIQALPIQALLANAQGNKELALQHVETVFKLRMQDAQNKFNYEIKKKDALWAYANKQEQRALDALEKEEDRRFLRETNDIEHSRAVALEQMGMGGSVGGGLSPLSEAIIENPTLFDDLTATKRGEVINELSRAGINTSNLGTKALSDTAQQNITQTQTALNDLAELREIIVGNTDQLGPIKGLARLNPWSDARKLQADVDRVRQTVGKALEGGVLRKEDEEKYKKILATLSDTPSTALYKIDALNNSIQRNIDAYKELQQASGRSLDVRTPLQVEGEEEFDFESLRTKYNY